MISVPFTKMNGAGNDFVVVNDLARWLQIDLPEFAKAVCAKGFGVGADGLLVLRPHGELDFEMIYLNSDGSEGVMCGNGGRCIARFALLNMVCSSPMTFMAHGCVYKAELMESRNVKLHMPDPENVTPHLKIPLGPDSIDTTYVNPNTDHIVLTRDAGLGSIESADLIPLARKIRYNSDIFPRGTNVNLIQDSGVDTIRMRTYERGVENETLACGTGAVASAITAAIRYDMKSPIKIVTTGGETLRVSFTRNGYDFSDISLEGSATVVFQGHVMYDERDKKILDLMDGPGKV